MIGDGECSREQVAMECDDEGRGISPSAKELYTHTIFQRRRVTWTLSLIFVTVALPLHCVTEYRKGLIVKGSGQNGVCISSEWSTSLHDYNVPAQYALSSPVSP